MSTGWIHLRNSLFILTALIFFSVSANAGDEKLVCVSNSNITIPSAFKAAKIEESDYCYNLNPWKLVSKSCYDGPCKALEYYNLAMPKASEFGTADSKLCRSAGGEPQTIFFTTPTGDQKFNRCYFDEDNSFVDLSTFAVNQTQIALPVRDAAPLNKPTAR